MKHDDAKDAVVLLSGGLDSATAMAIARQQGFRLNAMSFHYGQRHELELECARRLAAAMEVARHIEVKIDLNVFGHSALTADIPVPKDRRLDAMGGEIPLTYVPARNTIFLAHALAWAEVLPSRHIFLGVNALDYSGYPDCRPEYVRAFESLANLATRAGVEGRLQFQVHTPLMEWTKAEIIRRGMELGVDYSATLSCYDPSPRREACGRCDACQLRLKGFAENQMQDPAPYQRLS